VTTAGAVLFAHYAYAPNELGYCGPAETEALFELGVTGHTDADVVAIARRFSGAWPYAAVLAELAGIDDPLDERVMRAYWTGSELLDEVDDAEFGRTLLERIRAQAGHYWQHLSGQLLPEAAPTHGFHVFGVYPWSRLLAQLPEPALNVLDNCRIRWGRVVAVEGEHVVVHSRRLTWNGCALGLAAPTAERVRLAVDGRSFVPDAAAGDLLTLHWDSVCERLDPERLDHLRRGTAAQLRVTNARLARERVTAAGAA
jgi:Family of unknown function (DUF6390)